MLGNDIVDLQLAKTQSNWKRKGYLDKIFTNDEQELISLAKNPDEMLWLLWSMKESAYKIHNRKTGIRNYAPKSLKCSLISNSSQIYGKVDLDENSYFTKSDLQRPFVHTIASADSGQLEQIKVAVYESPNNLFDYKSTFPDCVSHHGRYLALIYGVKS